MTTRVPTPREIHLNTEEAKKLPCGSTLVSWGRSKGEIDGLLYDYGIENIQWTKWGDVEVLIFTMEVTLQGVKRHIAFQFTVPRIYIKKRVSKGGSWAWEDQYARDPSWRMFYWHLKSKLEAVRYGIGSAEVEMMAEVLHSLPDGSQATLGETVGRVIAEDRLDKLALPSPERRFVEVEAAR